VRFSTAPHDISPTEDPGDDNVDDDGDDQYNTTNLGDG